MRRCAVQVSLHQRQNGVPVDVYWSKGFFYFKQETSLSSVDSTVRVKILPKASEGVPVGVMNTQVIPSAQNSNGSVAITPGGATVKALATNPDTTFKFTENQVKSGPGNVRKFDPTFGMCITSTAGVPVGPPCRDFRVPSVRCDSLTYFKGSGCVVRPDPQRRNVPILDLTAGPSNNTQLYDHVLWAQNSGLPGNPAVNEYTNTPTPLTRITDGDEHCSQSPLARSNPAPRHGQLTVPRRRLDVLGQQS